MSLFLQSVEVRIFIEVKKRLFHFKIILSMLFVDKFFSSTVLEFESFYFVLISSDSKIHLNYVT